MTNRHKTNGNTGYKYTRRGSTGGNDSGMMRQSQVQARQEGEGLEREVGWTFKIRHETPHEMTGRLTRHDRHTVNLSFYNLHYICCKASGDFQADTSADQMFKPCRELFINNHLRPNLRISLFYIQKLLSPLITLKFTSLKLDHILLLQLFNFSTALALIRKKNW